MTTLLAKIRGLPRWTRVAAIVTLVAIVAGGVYTGVSRIGKPQITAYFPSTVGLYKGDEVRILGVRVGTIDSVDPGKDKATVKMTIDRGIDIPADAKAVLVSPSVVSARFIQLAPAYTGGAKMHDGSVIPLERTAVPVEWDDIKVELNKLATSLGPVGEDKQGTFGRFVNTAADNLDGNGQAFRDTLKELSATLTTLSDGRTDLFGTIKNLQQFVDVLSKSNDQIVQFGGRLASVSQVLAGVSGDLGAGLDNLDSAVSDVKKFLDSHGTALSTDLAQLADVTSTLVEKRPQIEQVLHTAPTALVNFYQLYNPAQGTVAGYPVFAGFNSPMSFICGSIDTLSTGNGQESAKMCAQYLAPVIQNLAMNYPPLLFNDGTGATALPNQLVPSTPDVAARYAAQGERAPVGIPNGLSGLAIPGGN
ncbi:MCE family protein [Nocardia tengchongensis]|uniref:MCE family protein n=1 Tax=Nocardia tengchongensis TaxID=2055889 RepID=A0ABX8CTJ2_9NOCA|nr:MCE family protein [Nocardia tengchongensis]QVI22179.1 MCE family protein [Nocardia tengchongensis]